MLLQRKSDKHALFLLRRVTAERARKVQQQEEQEEQTRRKKAADEARRLVTVAETLTAKQDDADVSE